MVGSSEKTCTKCKKTFPIEEYRLDKSKPDGHSPRCRPCMKVDRHLIYIKNPDKENAYARQWRENNMDRVKEAAKEWVKNNRSRTNEISKEWRSRNADKQKTACRNWISNNIERHRATRNKALKKLRSTPMGKINKSISSTMCAALGREKQGRRWESLVGYTVHDLKEHLERLFKDGMNWDNYVLYGWHIDHKIPIAAFNFEKPQDIDFKKCWSLKNLQPMWALENLQKNDYVEIPFQPSLLI